MREIDAIGDDLDATGAVLVVFLCGTGVRPEEAFGGEWRDVDLEWRVFMVRRAFGRAGSRTTPRPQDQRAVPLRTRVVQALEAMPVKRRGILFPAPEGGRIDIND